jgi:ribonuclease D
VQVLPEQKSAPNIQALLENPEVTKIFHFARMDLIFLKIFEHSIPEYFLVPKLQVD